MLSRKRKADFNPFRVQMPKRKAVAARRTRIFPQQSRGKWAPYAKSQVVSLHYTDLINVDAGASGVIGDYVFSCNGLFDPDSTGGGHQPYGFDQIAAQYGKYVVKSSRIKVWCWNDAASDPVILMVQVRPTSTTQDGNAPAYQGEQPGIVKTVLSPKGADDLKFLTHSYNAASFHGVKDVTDNTDLTAAVTANPTEGAFYHVMVGSLIPASNLGPKYMLVDIEYVAEFKEPLILAQS